jgi:hypothetical protein
MGKTISIRDALDKKGNLDNMPIFRRFDNNYFCLYHFPVHDPVRESFEKMRKEGREDDEEGWNPNLYFCISFCGQCPRSGP